MIALLSAGGPVLILLALCACLAVYITVERLLALRQQAIAPDGVRQQFVQLMQVNRLDEEQLNLFAQSSLLGGLLVAAYRHKDQDSTLLHEQVQLAGKYCDQWLHKHMDLIAVLATISPLLGVLGTIIGMIDVFGALNVQGQSDQAALALGITKALITTAVGLIVSVFCTFTHRFLLNRANGWLLFLEGQGLEIISLVNGPEKQSIEQSKEQSNQVDKELE